MRTIRLIIIVLSVISLSPALSRADEMPDNSSPVASAGRVRMHRGVRGYLTYGCLDDSGISTATITIYRNERVFRRIYVPTTPAMTVRPKTPVRFKAPNRVSGKHMKYYFTVQCVDGNANASEIVRGKLTILR